MNSQTVGLYLHIPFCRNKCPYCDFYSVPFVEELADAYIHTLVRAMQAHPFGELRADTLYLGGGTPSLLGAARLTAILESSVRHFGLSDDCEITLEANPESVTSSLLSDLRLAGFNRLCLGVQSCADDELSALGRTHTFRQAEKAILDGHNYGFENISADLMLAIPGQNAQSLSQSIRLLAGLPLTHISAYLLKVEPGTLFAQKKQALPNEDEAASLYLQCVDELAKAGFAQYEISNFCLPSMESRHNLKYWRRQPYLGLGSAAHSFVGKRFFFPADLRAFLATEYPFDLITPEDPAPAIEEELMLRLRLTKGFDLSVLANQGVGPAPLLQKADKLATLGLCRVEGNNISLTPQGFLLSNPIIAEFTQALEDSGR